MWFTEEAGNKVGRIDMDGKITEFSVPSITRFITQRLRLKVNEAKSAVARP
jgi:hypothetical protein